MIASRRLRSVVVSVLDSLEPAEPLPELGVVVPELSAVTELMGRDGSRSAASWAGIVLVWLTYSGDCLARSWAARVSTWSEGMYAKKSVRIWDGSPV